MKKPAKHGGKRTGAGRPRKLPRAVPAPSSEINWAEVERFANVGATEEEIVDGFDIPEALLKQPEVSDRLRKVVLRGLARKKLLLRETADKVGRGEARGGSNTLSQELQNLLGWGKQMESQEPPPDLTSVRAMLRLTLERLAKVRSEDLGRVVEPAEILLSVAYPPDGEKVH